MLSFEMFKKLRNEIVLNSLFLKDYNNSFNIENQKVCDFFDSALDYYKDIDLDNITTEMLYNYYMIYENDPLATPRAKVYAKVIENDYNEPYYIALIDDINEIYKNDLFICFDRKSGINNDIINTLIDNIYNYSDYDLTGYYKNNLAALIIDNLKDYKKISLKSALKIAKSIKNKDNFTDFILISLNAIYNKRYEKTKLIGSCQGDICTAYFCVDSVDSYYLQYAEAVIFNTGVEIMIHDSDNIPENADEIDGYYDYFINWDIKKQIANRCGCNENDVILYEISEIKTYTKVIYKKAD